MTLLELVVSAALLLTLTGIAMQFFAPVLDRTAAMDSHQEKLQRLVLLREYMDARLKNVQLQRVTSEAFEYYAPETVDTTLGPMIKIDPAQVVAYDRTRLLRLACQDGQVAERGSAHPRLLWNLGPTGRWRIGAMGPSMLRVTLYGQDRALHDQHTMAWEKSLFLVVPRLNFAP